MDCRIPGNVVELELQLIKRSSGFYGIGIIGIFFLLAQQEPGCSLLQGPVSHAGFLGARAAESECWTLSARGKCGNGGIPWKEGTPPLRVSFHSHPEFDLQLMCELGNSTMNQIYEAQCEELGLKKPTAGSSR